MKSFESWFAQDKFEVPEYGNPKQKNETKHWKLEYINKHFFKCSSRNIYIGLLEWCDGVSEVDKNGTGYERVRLDLIDDFTLSECEGFLDIDTVSFNTPRTDWGQIVGFALFKDEFTEERVFRERFPTSKTVRSGDEPKLSMRFTKTVA